MDLATIAETSVEMWCMIDAKLIARKQENIDPEIKAVIHREAMSLYMTHIINEKKASYPASPKGEADEEHCQDCGRKFTEKELEYLKDTTPEKRLCYHCSHK